MSILKPQHKVNGGVHPQYNKDLTKAKSIVEMPLPDLLRVSMSQHLGAPAKPLVKKGDAVLRGQLIGEPAGFISAAVHSPTSGIVTAIEQAPTASGSAAPCVCIEPDGKDAWDPGIEKGRSIREGIIKEFYDSPEAKRDVIIGIIADSGIAGMGGAGFPTHVKLSPPPDKPIDTVIINGAECEPYLTADARLMIERSEEIWTGARIIQKILGADRVRIAIEDNKPEAIEAMNKAIDGDPTDVAVVALQTEYPQGAEKQQIFAITGKEVPSGGLPMEVGCVVENVGTCLAIWNAVINGLPLIERVTTVTGTPVGNPGNVLARIGTSYEDLINFCGKTNGAIGKVISGGPMMGFAQNSINVATTKTTSGLLILPPEAVSEYSSMACISCGRCLGACPTYLMPNELSQFIEAEDYESAEEYSVMDCIECGCCSFECPAHRPLVQHMRQGKGAVMAKRRAEKK
jgi:electron transport complex protein RnfC